MADIKTHLRELSVSLMLGIQKNNLAINTEDLFDSHNFYKIASQVIDSDISSAKNIRSVTTFSGNNASILENGFRLGRYLYEHEYFKISPNDTLLWMGNNTQKNDLIDIKIGNYGFSLKEESFILENMGLYKFLNLMTNSSYKRGLHIFKTFAQQEYQQWFHCTWKLLTDKPCWHTQNDGYFSDISSDGKKITLNYNNQKKSIIPLNISSIEQFEKSTTSKTREKVFAKWISDVAAHDPKYIKYKKACAEAAGNNICTFIRKNFSPIHLTRFLQIYPNEYYYAKSNLEELKVFKVPSLNEFAQYISFSSIDYDVPTSQLNILTELHNDITGKFLHIRNECRFSHGQFNGTPEAKMYYGQNEDLSTVYIPINNLI